MASLSCAADVVPDLSELADRHRHSVLLLRLYAPHMKFTVYVDDGDGQGPRVYEEYGGESVYTVVESGALVVRPEEGGRVTFGPGAWSRVEEASNGSHNLPEIMH